MNQKELTQEEKVLKYLENHIYIDRPTAMDVLHIWNLTAVISELRKHGHPIVAEKVKKGKSYVHYRLGDRK